MAPAPDIPKVRFHYMRHTHASALIAGGLDVCCNQPSVRACVAVVTLSVYAHVFKKSDEGAAAAIEVAMRTGAEGSRCQFDLRGRSEPP